MGHEAERAHGPLQVADDAFNLHPGLCAGEAVATKATGASID